MYCHFVKMLIWFLPCFTHKFHDWSTVLDLFFASDKGLLSRWLEHTSGQIIANSAEVTPNGGVVRESSQNPLNSGLGIIVICPDTSIAWELPLPIWRDFPVLNLYYIDDISLYIYIYLISQCSTIFVLHHPTLRKIYNNMLQHFMHSKSKSCMYITYWPTLADLLFHLSSQYQSFNSPDHMTNLVKLVMVVIYKRDALDIETFQGHPGWYFFVCKFCKKWVFVVNVSLNCLH